MLYLGGPGAAWATPASGATPMNFGRVEEVTLDWDLGVKGNNGGYKLPVDFMGGEMKISGKLKMSAISVLLIAGLVMGVTPAAGSQLTQYLEPAAIPSAAAYTVTVANAATFVGELEVLYAATAQPLNKVSSAPAAGQYSVAAGVFTFSAADEGKGILISYNYTSTAGYTLTLNNALQGDTPTFGVTMYNKKNGAPISYVLPYCAANKFSRGAKANDYMKPEIDIMVGANAAGVALYEYYPFLA